MLANTFVLGVFRRFNGAGSEKALQSGLLIGEFREDLVEVGDFQNFFDIAGQSYNPHFSSTF